MLAGLVFSLGAHWAILQSFAWASMLVEFSRTAPICEALIKTFDGRHPCQLCLFVAAGKKADDQQPKPTLKKLQLELFLEAPPAIFLLETGGSPHFYLQHWRARRDPPPFPPPRFT